jgi:two-component system, OmpR family, copper resistance phosphate regulon response regulator CusR
MRILVVEDETKVARALREGLEAARYEVRTAATGEDGFFLAKSEAFDLLILDLMLPHCSGSDMLGMLREGGEDMPVLVLTAKDTVSDRVEGLDLGADDYMVKPFAFPELLARVRSLLRRGSLDYGTRKMFQDDLEMDVVARKVARDGQQINLTLKEFEVLEFLLRNKGHAVSREMLAQEVWKVVERVSPIDNAIDITIARLRRKIDDAFEPKLLRTVRGMGFILGVEHA